MADAWKKVEIGNTWNFKELGENATLEGLFVGVEENVGENKSLLYTLETKDGNVNVWGSSVLDTRLKNVKIGEEVKIVYLGQMESLKRKGVKYHNFEVWHRGVPYEEIK